MQGSRKLHYTFLIPSGAFGGLEMQMVKRAADAIQRGESSLFVGKPSSRPEQYARSMGIHVKPIRIKPDYVDLIGAYRLGKMMKSAESNVCVVSESKHLSLAILARKLILPELAVIFYQQLHGSRRKKDPYHNWVYRNVDGAVVITTRLKQGLVMRTCLPAERVEVIPLDVDLDSFDPSNHDKKTNRRRFNLPEETLLIGLVGRMQPSKGQEVALRALAKAGISNATLVLCGTPYSHDYLESLMTLSKKLGIQERVHARSPRPDERL